MLVGYARVSTVEQDAGFEAQKRDLKAAGCEKVFEEKVSSVAKRDKLDAALEFVREGDVLIVKKLDRLARSVAHLCQIVAQLEAKGCALRILDINLDTSTPTGKLMLNLLGSIGQFEREIMLERQREGIAKAKDDGKYKGRAPTARAKTDDVLRLAKEAEGRGMTRAQIAKELKISPASLYRILADARAA